MCFSLLISTSQLIQYRKAYDLLASRIPQLLNTGTSQQETRALYPNVKYWTRQEWITANADRVADLDGDANVGGRGRGRAAKGINVNMKYIEDKEGNPIDGHLASDIRRHARAIFVGIASKGQVFKSWTEADYDSLKTYYREMSERFEELRFCANDWKAELIALDTYRTWREQWDKQQKKKAMGKGGDDEKLDADVEDFHDSDDEDSLKHGIDHPPSEARRAKKAKTDNTPNFDCAVPTAAELQPSQTVSQLQYLNHAQESLT